LYGFQPIFLEHLYLLHALVAKISAKMVGIYSVFFRMQAKGGMLNRLQ
jgi:hypothetical protein